MGTECLISNSIFNNLETNELQKIKLKSESKSKSVYRNLLVVFLSVKFIIFSLAHISVLYVSPNNYAADLILFEHDDLNIFDKFLKYFVRPFIRWDAIHMLAIARDGYIFENQFAFFPLLPVFCRYISQIFLKCLGLKQIVSIEALISFVALLFVNLSHFIATIILFRLTLHFFKSKKFAKLTALLYIFNPASIQLSSMYSEAPFALFTFSGLYAFYTNRKLVASLLWALASLTRSNGIVLVGFFFFDLFNSIFNEKIAKIIKNILLTLIFSAISLSGFVAFQIFAYNQFCIGSSKRPWCNNYLPNIYTFVQHEYWNVGLFNYFTIRQIPNFLIALPMILLCSAACFSYFEVDHLRFLSIGLLTKRAAKTERLKLFMEKKVLPHIYLLVFMLFYNVFIAHVQIITRVFTFMPVVYWFLAHLLMSSSITTQNYIHTFIGLYALLGTVLFSLNYPPA